MHGVESSGNKFYMYREALRLRVEEPAKISSKTIYFIPGLNRTSTIVLYMLKAAEKLADRARQSRGCWRVDIKACGKAGTSRLGGLAQFAVCTSFAK